MASSAGPVAAAVGLVEGHAVVDGSCFSGGRRWWLLLWWLQVVAACRAAAPCAFAGQLLSESVCS